MSDTDPTEKPARGRNPLLQVGESYHDAVDRIAGERRAAEIDRDRARTVLGQVLVLHSRQVSHSNDGDSFDTCSECSWESRGVFVEFPCPTVRRIQTTTTGAST